MALKKTLGKEGKKNIKGRSKNDSKRTVKPAVSRSKKSKASKKAAKKGGVIKKTKKTAAKPGTAEDKIARPIEERRRKGVELSVIIPAYNELERLPLTLVDVDRRLRQMDLSYEIIVVDDGSTDGTSEMVEKFLPIITRLRFLDNQENHGKGYVVRQGMLAAKGEIRLFMDADNSTTIDQFTKMKPHFEEGASVVIGSRAIKGAVLNPPQPWHKHILGKLGNLFIQLAAVGGIWDTQCGFKAFTAVAADDIFGRAKVDRWAFDIEALALARKLGYEIAEIPVYWINDLRSHVKMSAYLQVLWETVKISWRIRRGR